MPGKGKGRGRSNRKRDIRKRDREIARKLAELDREHRREEWWRKNRPYPDNGD